MNIFDLKFFRCTMTEYKNLNKRDVNTLCGYIQKENIQEGFK